MPAARSRARTDRETAEASRLRPEEESELAASNPAVFSGCVLLGLCLRFIGILNDQSREAVGARVEVVTPITDFARIREGSFLWSYGASPYAGDTLHQPPLVLALLSPLAGTPPPEWLLSFFFVTLQVLTAINIYGIGTLYASSAESSEHCCIGGLAAGDEVCIR
jgi:hypothetical protein